MYRIVPGTRPRRPFHGAVGAATLRTMIASVALPEVVCAAVPLGDAGGSFVAGLRWVAVGFGLLMTAGTVLSMFRVPWWIARMWDFPRIQIAAFCLLSAALAVARGLPGGPTRWAWSFVGLMALTAAWQAWKIYPYLPIAPNPVKRSERGAVPGDGRPTVLRVVISNVLQENRQFDRWREVVSAADADVVAAAEVTEEWVREIERLLGKSHPHKFTQPQNNYYGMGLWSRLPLEDVKLEFLVQDDIPSIHATLRFPEGSAALLHVLHPRPPAPQENDSSSARDAELVVMARRIKEENEGRGGRHAMPTLVMGDLNDVAWSRTTQLFCRLSGLLDPRRGRGLFNTFHAGHWWVRFPLDHVFISPEFRLVEMRVLDNVGSDHFPVFIEVSLEPEGSPQQDQQEPTATDEEEADEAVETQVERERDGLEQGHLAESSDAGHTQR